MVKGPDDNFKRDDLSPAGEVNRDTGTVKNYSTPRDPHYGNYEPAAPRDRPLRSDYRPRYDERRSSDEIRADIDRTRAELDHTIDELHRRLAPERLIHNVFDVLREHVNEGVRRTVQIVRDNPIPSAMIGIGAIWLIASHMNRCRVAEIDLYEYEEYERYGEPTQTALSTTVLHEES